MSHFDKCPKVIPIGKQKFAYQCEDVVLSPVHGAIDIRAYIPHKGGSEPYPNAEKDKIKHYDLKIAKFTGNSLEINFVKKFKDGSETMFLSTISFSDLVNRIFEGQTANYFETEAPVQVFE